MLLLIKRNTAICKLASLEGYKKKRKMNEFKEKKNGEGRFLRLPRLSYRDETIRVTFAIWYTLMNHSAIIPHRVNLDGPINQLLK